MKVSREIGSLAPVLITTLCRYNLFRRCVESLSKCRYASDTDLFIALDYPLKDSHIEGYQMISNYLDSITGFRNITVIRRSVNYGPHKNETDAMNILLMRYEKVIFSEDDNEFSPNFLDFINNGLVKYKDNQSIFAVCGYNFPITISKSYKYNHYFSQEFCGWGYGIWKDKYMEYEKCCSERYIREKLEPNLRFLRPSLVTCLILIIKNRRMTGDAIVSLKLIDEGLLCVFPKISLVRNTGFDGTGQNNRKTIKSERLYCLQEIDKRDTFDFDDISDISTNKEIRRLLDKYFRIDLLRKIRSLLLLIYYKTILKNPDSHFLW